MSTEQDKRKPDDDGPIHGYPIDEGRKTSPSKLEKGMRKAAGDHELQREGTFKKGHAGEGPKGFSSGNTPQSFDPEQKDETKASGSHKGNPDKYQQDGVEGVKTRTEPPGKKS